MLDIKDSPQRYRELPTHRNGGDGSYSDFSILTVGTFSAMDVNTFIYDLPFDFDIHLVGRIPPALLKMTPTSSLIFDPGTILFTII